jgi:hypothetical protein
VKRALFLTLLLVNLGLFAWYHWYELPSHADPAPSVVPGGAPLKLMSELSASDRKALAQTAVQAAPPPSTTPAVAAATRAPAASTSVSAVLALACASYGPFPTADAAAQGLARLKSAGLAANQHIIPGKTQRGYWVFLPPFGTRHEADAAADMLRKKGVKDIYVVADEANRNAVSLGVFNQKSGAVERERDMKKLGFKPQMAERFRDEPRYWLDARGPDAALPAAEVFKDLGEDAAPVGKATAPCAG